MHAITKKHLATIKDLHHCKGRKEQQRFIVEGQRALHTFLQAGWDPIALFATEKEVAKLQALAPGTLVAGVTDEVMQKMSAATTASGMLGIFAIPKQPAAEKLAPGLVLAQIADPGNMGTLIRTSAAMGKKSIVIVEGTDPLAPKVVQASAGAIALVDIFSFSWNQLLENKKDLKLCALIARGGKKPQELDLKNSLLVIGSEALGLPQSQQNDCEQLLTLAMPGQTESLNAAVAGSIALYIAINN